MDRLRNNFQQHATRNRMCKRTPYVTSNNVSSVCTGLKRGARGIMKGYRLLFKARSKLPGVSNFHISPWSQSFPVLIYLQEQLWEQLSQDTFHAILVITNQTSVCADDRGKSFFFLAGIKVLGITQNGKGLTQGHGR